MVFQEINSRDIEEMCKWLEFYDAHGYLPFRKKRIDITLSYDAIARLKDKSKELNKPISLIIEEGI